MGLMPIVCAVSLLFPAWPDRWDNDEIFRENEISNPAPVVMPTEKDLALQQAALAGENEPALRMRIAADLSATASEKAFAILEEAFVREKDAALRSCCLRCLAVLDRNLGAGKTPLQYTESVEAALRSPSALDRIAAASLLLDRNRVQPVFAMLEREKDDAVLRNVFARFNPAKPIHTKDLENLARGGSAAKKFALGYLAASQHNNQMQNPLAIAVKSAPAEELVYAAANLAGNPEQENSLLVLLQRKDLPPAIRAAALSRPLPNAAAHEKLLLAWIADADPGVRMGAAASLAAIRSEPAKQALVKAFSDENASVRAAAAQALAGYKMKTLPAEILAAEKIHLEGLALLMGCSGNPAYLPRLRELLQIRGNACLTAACIRAFGELNAKDDCARLTKFAEKQQPEISDALAFTMLRFHDNPVALKTLEQLLGSIQSGVGGRIARALRDPAVPEFQDPLAAVIVKPSACSAEVRLECIRSLAAHRKWNAKTVRALSQVLQGDIREIPGGRTTDLVPLRAGAYHALKLHESDPAVKAALKSFAGVRHGKKPLPDPLPEYLNQIDRACAGKKANPSALPVVRGNPALKGL